jgi:hypothetical protein
MKENETALGKGFDVSDESQLPTSQEVFQALRGRSRFLIKFVNLLFQAYPDALPTREIAGLTNISPANIHYVNSRLKDAGIKWQLVVTDTIEKRKYYKMSKVESEN